MKSFIRTNFLGLACMLATFAAGINIAMADGTETLGPPSIDIASGSGAVAAGTGMFEQIGQPGAGRIDIDVPGNVVQALLYWEGYETNAVDFDDTLTVRSATAKTAVTGVLIGGPTYFFTQNGIDNYSRTYRADITNTGLVQAGPNSLVVGGMMFGSRNNGVGVLVIYDDGTQTEIQLRDGNDLAFREFAPPLNTTVPQTFQFAASSVDRLALMPMFFSSVTGPGSGGGPIRPTTIEINTGGQTYFFDDVLVSIDGPEWGTYTLEVTIPAGATSLTVQARSEERQNPGQTNPYPASFAWSAAALTIPPPDVCTGSIGDFVWQDTNRNGQQDLLEPGIAGVTVSITDNNGFFDSTITAGDGSYSFTGLACDTTYTVSIAIDPDANTYVRGQVDIGPDATDSDNHNGVNVTLTSASPSDQTIDFGYELIPASLGDFVWLDADQDGLQGANEPGLEGIEVVLKDCNLNMIPGRQTTTDQNGFYLFEDLDPGTYVVMFMAPNGFTFTTKDAFGNANDATDSDVNPGTGNTDCITLDAGENERDVDAGMYQGAGLGNYVWHDLNANGIQDESNTGIEGVRVDLLDCDMNPLDPAMTDFTDSDGLYEFLGLPAGCYIVMFSMPAGFDAASPTGAGAFDTDSDADPVTGKTGPIDLMDGQFDPDWDAGFYKTATLGDRVWNDIDLDGLQGANEPGIPNCTVNLQGTDNQGNDVDLFDTTDANGNYLFENLVPGEYMVQFSNDCTDNWVYTQQNVNDPADDDIDSDANSAGKTAAYTLTSGEDNRTVDAGLHAPAAPAISIEKATSATENDPNADDADLPTGPYIPFEAPVYWTYVVTNTGNRDLFNVVVMDNNGTPFNEFDDFPASCPQDTLVVSESMTCTASNPDAILGQYANVGTATGEDADQNMVTSDDPSHYFGAVPLIDIEKATNGFDADSPDPNVNIIPVIPVGETVTWTYVVTNTGNVPLTNIEVSDNEIFPPVLTTCPTDSLPAPSGNPNDPLPSFTCTVEGIAMDTSNMNPPYGVFENVAAVSAEGPPGAGNPPNDSDPSHYIGGVASIDIEKATNGFDADQPTGPQIPLGDPVTWTYVVMNTGNVPLTDVSVTDSILGAISCPKTVLAVAESMICTANGTAEAGQYRNDSDVTGTPPSGPPVTDEDPSHYFGTINPRIDIEKATNGFDADQPTGPQIPLGDPVTWTYVVTNTGDVRLTGVSVTDSILGAITCPTTVLEVGESMTCTANGTAEAGQYRNDSDVTGTPPFGPPVSDEDPSHYFGVANPGIDIEKATNGIDADDPNAGDAPQIVPGAPVNWTYLVTNTGDVQLTNVSVTDDQGVAVSCPTTVLEAGASMTCTASGFADDLNNTSFTTVPGLCGGFPGTPLYRNMGTASGETANGEFVQDADASHYCNEPMPAIDIEKATDDRNGVPRDADQPRGPGLLVGNPVNWTYVVTNTGNVALTNVTVTDDQGVAVNCPANSLAVGASMTCTASGVAIKGQYANVGTVTGTPPAGNDVSDSDPSHYFGLDPQIDIEKATNGEDADTPTGPAIPVGGTATFTYVVDNPSNEGIKNVVVTDDQGVTVSPVDVNPADGFNDGDLDKDNVLDFNETWTYTGSATVTAGQYANIGTVTGLGNNTNKPVQDADPSHHFGTTAPAIMLDKVTNGADGPDNFIPAGDPVTWTYTVSNIGDVPLILNDLKDDNGTPSNLGDDFTVSCPVDLLPVGGSTICEANSTATVGQYNNIAVVCGVDATGVTQAEVCDDDPSDYFGLQPAIHIEKATNGFDADQPTGPEIPVGGAVTWTYVVTNIGNEPIGLVSVTDNQGVVPIYQGGDSNGNSLLDLFETWTYAAAGTAEEGQYANVGRVFGVGSITNREVGDTDPSHYFGLAQCDLTIEKLCFVPPPPPSSNFACDKPIDSLTMIWDGTGTVWVRAWKGPVGSTSLGVKSVGEGEEITFTGFAGSPNDVFWEVYSDAGLINKLGESKFHLSCSDDDMDGPEDCGKLQGNGKDNNGSMLNEWLLEGMIDSKSTLDCTVNTDPDIGDFLQACEFVAEPAASCETEDKPKSLTFRYIPSDCSTTNDQEGRYSCSGGTLSGNATFALTADADKYTYNPASGMLQPDDVITITANGSDFESNFAFKLTGNTTQTYDIHTSCSKALAVGDVFGSFVLVGFNGKTAGQEVKYAYTVTNNGTGAVSNIDVTDNKIPGVIDTIASLGQGASETVYATAFLEATTTNIGTATGDLFGADDCEASSNAVTVTVLEPPKSCETDAKPTSLTLDVTGSCSDQDNFQDGKAKCDGPDITGAIVDIVITKDANKLGAEIIDGDTIRIFQTDKVGERLQSTLKFTITDINGNTQNHEIHASCSQPLTEGDLLGGLRLVEYVPAYN